MVALRRIKVGSVHWNGREMNVLNDILNDRVPNGWRTAKSAFINHENFRSGIDTSKIRTPEQLKVAQKYAAHVEGMGNATDKMMQNITEIYEKAHLKNAMEDFHWNQKSLLGKTEDVAGRIFSQGKKDGGAIAGFVADKAGAVKNNLWHAPRAKLKQAAVVAGIAGLGVAAYSYFTGKGASHAGAEVAKNEGIAEQLGVNAQALNESLPAYAGAVNTSAPIALPGAGASPIVPAGPNIVPAAEPFAAAAAPGASFAPAAIAEHVPTTKVNIHELVGKIVHNPELAVRA